MPTEYRTLSFPFQKHGWTHELIERDGLVCLVRRHKRGMINHFEVIHLRQRPAHVSTHAGREIAHPAREVYPSSEDWGTYGFTYQQDAYQKAHSKFRSMIPPTG